MSFEIGDRITIPVSVVEFVVGGNTIWVQSPQGATVLRIQSPPGTKIVINELCENCVSHVDVRARDPIEVCLANDANGDRS
jgi:hypothetical protein